MADKREVRPVEATFVFQDSLGKPIPKLDVVLKSVSFEQNVVTDEKGLAWASSDIKRNEKIAVAIKKRNGTLSHKFNVVPDRDINAFTFNSAEFHVQGTTKLSPEELLEQFPFPEIKVGEVMTAGRLLGELAPFVGAFQIMEDIGKVVKDVPKKKKIPQTDPVTGKPGKPIIEIEHHYVVTKTDKPVLQSLNVLGEKLNYPNPAASPGLLKSVAEEFGCEIEALMAIGATECGGQPFFPNGLPKILFERHHFYKHTKPAAGKHPFAAYSDICNPNGGEYGKESVQYPKLVKASLLDREAAIMSCSWGTYQVLGAYWKQLGYTSADHLADECMASADGHLKLFRLFLKMKEKKPAIEALKAKNWEKFTTYYNGAAWRTTNPEYPGKMAEHYATYKK